MNRRTLLLILALGAWAVGCSEREERQVSAKVEFEIPLTLVQRMMEAHDKVLSNAQEVVTQPRGEMRFADDGLDEAGRTKIWPFDLECLRGDNNFCYTMNRERREVNHGGESW